MCYAIKIVLPIYTTGTLSGWIIYFVKWSNNENILTMKEVELQYRLYGYIVQYHMTTNIGEIFVVIRYWQVSANIWRFAKIKHLVKI